MRPRYGLQFWGKKPPSKRDALVMLNYALSLLSESLPLALSSVASADIAVQENFWREYLEFDRHSGFTFAASQKHREEEWSDVTYSDAIAVVLEDYREIVEIRVSKPTGEIA